ncbi:MAG: hypothetical protein HZA48_09240 [Planctomycetes bacterium]|nr:hypothetical protein [Planctomycetota bacterium]
MSLILFPLLYGCGSMSSKTYMDSPPLSNSYNEIWEATRGAIAKSFKISSEDREKGAMETEWSAYQSVAFDDGTRKKVFAKIRKNDTGAWTVSIAVQVQEQSTVDGGTYNPSKFWSNTESDEDEARIILTNIRIKLTLLKKNP